MTLTPALRVARLAALEAAYAAALAWIYEVGVQEADYKVAHDPAHAGALANLNEFADDCAAVFNGCHYEAIFPAGIDERTFALGLRSTG